MIDVLEKAVSNLQGQIDEIKSNKQPLSEQMPLEAAISNFISQNPEMISVTLENFYKKKTVEEQHKAIAGGVSAILTSFQNGDLQTFSGKADAKINVIEFFDYSCSFCSKMLETNQKLIEQNNDIKIIFIELPMLGAESLEATRFATAISMIEQSKYLPFQVQLLKSTLPRNRDNMMSIASSLGLDASKVQKFIDENLDKIEERIKQNSIVFNNMKLQGTPTYIVGDDVFVGVVSIDKLNEAILKVRNQSNPASQNGQPTK